MTDEGLLKWISAAGPDVWCDIVWGGIVRDGSVWKGKEIERVEIGMGELNFVGGWVYWREESTE
jgi:hypothetical protein